MPHPWQYLSFIISPSPPRLPSQCRSPVFSHRPPSPPGRTVAFLFDGLPATQTLPADVPGTIFLQTPVEERLSDFHSQVHQRGMCRPCGPMDKAPDYGSGDSRFESWQGRMHFFWIIFSSICTLIPSEAIPFRKKFFLMNFPFSPPRAHPSLPLVSEPRLPSHPCRPGITSFEFGAANRSLREKL